jgi:hypothetical protein
MSGLPPPGIRHFWTTLPLASEMIEIDPSARLPTYRTRESRLTYSP